MTPPAAPRPTVNVSIDVPDLGAGLAFYGAVFGFHETARPFPTMEILDGNNVGVCLHEKPEGSASSGAGTPRRSYARHRTPAHLDLYVENFDDTLARVEAPGGRIEHTIRDTGPRYPAVCTDPFGSGFCVIGPRRTG